ncbi:viral A-type inclusion protein [Reticulomyxa filosa]|uniref:Viral A-type inclusion protein n=1 Tax=Reticulomyxa filosa TaxID=46433 RepID=X6NFS0_RETFI|nr:viral A-type inclusion protein [Reticulomyxa filosa]|eukprot:ETO25170.1 viral A-type inclusion protein [Reticulomyxa filosa]
MSYPTSMTHIPMLASIYANGDNNNNNNNNNNDNDNKDEKQKLAIKAAQEFMLMVSENDKLNRENEILQTGLEDLKAQLVEVGEELQSAHRHSRNDSVLAMEKQQLQMENEALETQIKMLQERVDDLAAVEQEPVVNPTPPPMHHHHTQSNSLLNAVSNNDKATTKQGVLFCFFFETQNKLLEKVLQKLDDEARHKEQVQHEINAWRKKYEELQQKTVTHETAIAMLSGELRRVHQDQEELEQAFEADLQDVEEVHNVTAEAQEENVVLMEQMKGITLEKSKAEQQAALFEEKLKHQQSVIDALNLQKDQLAFVFFFFHKNICICIYIYVHISYVCQMKTSTQLEEMQSTKLAKDDEMFLLLRDLHTSADRNKASDHAPDMSRSFTEDDALQISLRQFRK